MIDDVISLDVEMAGDQDADDNHRRILLLLGSEARLEHSEASRARHPT